MTRCLFRIPLLAALTAACPSPTPVAQAPLPAPPPAPVAQPAPPVAEDTAAVAAERRRAEAARLHAIVTEPIHFDFDRADIRADARGVLDRKLEVLSTQRQIHLRLEGHADERGSDEYNLALGMRRAAAARSYLASRGIDPGRLDVMSHGEERPADQSRTEAGWARNRRAEFVVTSGTVTITD